MNIAIFFIIIGSINTKTIVSISNIFVFEIGVYDLHNININIYKKWFHLETKLILLIWISMCGKLCRYQYVKVHYLNSHYYTSPLPSPSLSLL